jgi:OOP family OmpA-OmpF porin
MNRSHLALFLVACLFTAVGAVKAQDNLRAQLFNDADRALNQAKEKKADMYGPISFEKAMEYYSKADEEYKSGKNLEDIREKLQNAVSYFAKAVEACKLGEVTFSSTMAARNDASSAGAPKFTAETWEKSENLFKKAARTLEDGDVNGAKEQSLEAEKTYRLAELEAIKANYLNPARALLKKSDETRVREDAPRTLEKAQKLTTQAENLLTQNRYDTDEARQLAQEARYEAAHALYLAQAIRQMRAQDKKMEDALLDLEAQIQKITSSLGVVSRFDAGYDTPVSEAVNAIKSKDTGLARSADSLRRSTEALRASELEIDNLTQQIGSMKNRVGTLTENEMELQRKLNLKHEQDQTIRQVYGMFAPEEGNVLRDGDNIILRLYGLTFPVGKSTIEQQYYNLLTKVQDAIRKFPHCKVTVEGHTDSQGPDDINQKLSEGRAKAVAEYLMANMNVEIPIAPYGFGETRPVASNDTPEGRAKNRRIDIVITPEWAGAGR